MKYALGWIPDKPDDGRDRKFFAAPRLIGLPSHVDLSPECCEVYDQGQIGSCAPNAATSAYRFALKKSGKPDFRGSRLFLYYIVRAMEGTVRQDAGSSIRDNFRALAKQGLCSEASWPYLPDQFRKHPAVRCYVEGMFHQAIEYRRVNPMLGDMKACLADGFPFVFGVPVYPSMMMEETAKTGHVPMPFPGEVEIGGHAIKAVGYDDATKLFKFKNSWGKWGAGGYGFLPYAYMARMASDCWTVRVVE